MTSSDTDLTATERALIKALTAAVLAEMTDEDAEDFGLPYIWAHDALGISAAA